MDELPKEIKQSEKYPDEVSSVVLGNCYDKKTTAEIARRYNCHDDLLTAVKILMALCEEAYAEGYGEGYLRGIEPDRDESCVTGTTIFKNDFAKAWKRSETKAAIAKSKE